MKFYAKIKHTSNFILFISFKNIFYLELECKNEII